MLPLLQIIHTTANHAVPYMEERGIIYAFPKSNRGKYCPDYTAKVFRRKKADRRQKRYSRSASAYRGTCLFLCIIPSCCC